MIASLLPKYMVVMLVMLLVLTNYSMVEAVRRDEIKGLLVGAKFAETIVRANMNACTACLVQCVFSCKSFTTCTGII